MSLSKKEDQLLIISIVDESERIVRIRLSKKTSLAVRAEILHFACNGHALVSISGRTITIRSPDDDGIPAWAYRAAWSDSFDIRPERPLAAVHISVKEDMDPRTATVPPNERVPLGSETQ